VNKLAGWSPLTPSDMSRVSICKKHQQEHTQDPSADTYDMAGIYFNHADENTPKTMYATI
jgi:hypothetical protein